MPEKAWFRVLSCMDTRFFDVITKKIPKNTCLIKMY